MTKPQEIPPQGQDLANWWRQAAENEIEQTVAKAIEYGALDLLLMGQALGRMSGRSLSEQEAAELGCTIYLVGKVARIEAAWSEGRLPSLDTLFDVGVYVRMIQRIRERGGWPG